MVTWKQIEARRETRLWITQVIMPTLTIVGAAMSIPEVRNVVKQKASNIKNKIKAIFSD